MGHTIPLFLLLLQFVLGGSDAAAAVAAGTAPDPGGIPFKSEPAGSGVDLSRVAGTLALSLLLAFVAAWLLRRYVFSGGRGSGTAGGRIALRSARRITPQITALLVAVDDREYLLMQSRNGLQVIEHPGRPEEAKAAQAPGGEQAAQAPEGAE